MNSTYCCWRIEGKITKRLPLGEDKTSMVFWLENYGDKPFYYFGNNKLDLNDDSSIIVYPINIKHPKEMNYLYVDRIENKKL